MILHPDTEHALLQYQTGDDTGKKVNHYEDDGKLEGWNSWPHHTLHIVSLPFVLATMLAGDNN